ncbi:MAG: AEC family transporter [Burkholderiaceae bacterium]|nr:AEC family transporter [Burkholderiaceae bacterium]
MGGALLLAPDFALILLGFGLKRLFDRDERFWAGLEKLVYYVLFPALLFTALTRTPIAWRSAAPLVAVGFAATLAGMALALLARPMFRPPPLAFASQFQCAFRFNTYVGLAVMGKLHGAAGVAVMSILVGALVPVVNLAAVWMLARHGRLGLAGELARNPLVLATVAGLAFNLAGLQPPALVAQFLSRLGEASIALGLLAVGAALSLRGGDGARATSAYLLTVKLLAVPATAWALAVLFRLDGVYFAAAVIFAALPAASSAYILAVRMGGDGPATARLITASTIAAMFTLPLWVGVIG